MTEKAESGKDSGWICNRCKVPLEVQKVRLQYSRTIFALDLPACPQCGMILIAEELATGKMAQAEQALEDK
jgi:predicted  nucleic acid-binding Zn-ribbon protein